MKRKTKKRTVKRKVKRKAVKRSVKKKNPLTAINSLISKIETQIKKVKTQMNKTHKRKKEYKKTSDQIKKHHKTTRGKPAKSAIKHHHDKVNRYHREEDARHRKYKRMLNRLKKKLDRYKDLKKKIQKEEAQRQRAEAFIKHADIKKWRKTAIAVKDFELFGNVAGIKETVVVTNGTTDKVHNQIDYPKIAKELPNGRFIYMETDESQREKLVGLMGYEFSKISKEEVIPQTLLQFEKDLNRNKE